MILFKKESRILMSIDSYVHNIENLNDKKSSSVQPQILENYHSCKLDWKLLYSFYKNIISVLF